MSSAENVDRVIESPPTVEEGGRDRWATAASVLGGLIALIIVSALSGFIYLYLTGVVNPPAPRTALEARTDLIETYLQTSPKNGKVWADYIVAQTNLGLYAQAEKAFKDAQVALAELPDQMIQADLAWAQSLMLQARPEEALAQADLVIANDPAALAALGKDNPEMIALGILTTGMLAPAHVVRGNSLVALGRWAEAAEAYTAAIEIDPRAADLLGLRAAAYLEAGEPDKARADAEEALRFLPDDARALRVLEELGDAR
jgi:tetratricopeptide (TPR) repeat protein